ncbi:MAG: TIGR01906 family membrane protein [Chloroflexota bacterium]|nr:TIGR01906 family membrane protein [Chloroflexota bacterium]
MTDTPLSAPATPRGLTFAPLLSWIITILIPPLLILSGVRLAMTPAFALFEYGRADFPSDFYGFTQDERREYAPYAVDYLLNGSGIDYLGDLTFPNGDPLFNSRELQHMVDVKVVTEWAYRIAFAAGLIAIIAIVTMAQRAPYQLRTALQRGAWLTLGLIGVVIVAAVLAWDVFFTAFHQIFFTGGSWLFLTSDTLIRLFPERFWFDAALFIGGFALIGALVLLFIAARIGKPLTTPRVHR